jgi:hypothetical protein
LALPLVGCLVNAEMAPLCREYILSSTKCLNLW